MKYIDEFRNKKLILDTAGRIKEIAPASKVNIMEVCGTHTNSFFRFGLHKLLPKNIRLVSGPGCPVCVSSQQYLDQAICYARHKDTLIATFGDLLRVPGSSSSLEKERAGHGNVDVVYSALEAVELAKKYPKKKVIFLAVGFETTIPTIALSILHAKKKRLRNIFFLCSLKLMPPAMEYLLKDKRLNIDGFLCPGHVSSIIGAKPYEFIPKKYKIACCIAGFEPLDIMEGIYLLLRQIVLAKPSVENQYIRVVTREGNKKAVGMINRVFNPCDTVWRGIGKIPLSGLLIRSEFSEFDATRQLPVKCREIIDKNAARCRCADVLKGLILPPHCPLFMKLCKPDNPIGPCMVSTEGACNAYYKYNS